MSEKLGERVHKLRKDRGLSLDKLAGRAGITKSYLWEIEQSRACNPSVYVANDLARALGVPLSYLVGCTESLPDLHPEALRIAIEVDALLRGRSTGTSTDDRWHEQAEAV